MTIATRLTFVSMFTFVGSNAWSQELAQEGPPVLEAATTPETRDLLTQVRIPPEKLPEHVQLIKTIRTSAFLPIESNPCVLGHPVAIKFVATHFGIFAGPELDAVRYAVVALYQEKTDANEIGVYGLSFADEEAAKTLFSKIMAHPEAPPLILNGKLLLYVWKDDGVSDTAFKAVRDYFTDADRRRRQVVIAAAAIVATACAIVAVRRRRRKVSNDPTPDKSA